MVLLRLGADKRLCEVFKADGTLATTYNYSPYGEVSVGGNITQPLQWSSEYNDSELGLVYYNYRHYNPACGRRLTKDADFGTLSQGGYQKYAYVNNSCIFLTDLLGLLSADPFSPACVGNSSAMPRGGEGWGRSVSYFYAWLVGNLPSQTTFGEASKETQVIRDSAIGEYIKNAFLEKNKDAKYCRLWKDMTNIEVDTAVDNMMNSFPYNIQPDNVMLPANFF